VIDGASDIASAWDATAALAPDRVALIDDGRTCTWSEFSERARRLSWHLAVEAKVGAGDRVAIGAGNDAEHLVAFYATLKLRGVPVNVDVRHGADGVHEVLDHSDAKAIVYGAERSKAVRAGAKRIQKPWRPLLISIDDQYERALAGAPPATEWQPEATSADDRIVIYTGGRNDTTTAVMWRSGDLLAALGGSRGSGVEVRPGPTVLPVASLTHTLGLFAALQALIGEGAVALVTLDPFEPTTVWESVMRDEVAILSVGSEQSVRKLIDVLRVEPTRWDLGGLRRIVAAIPLPEDCRAMLSDLLPTTEILEPNPAARRVGEHVRVVDDVTGFDVEPGSGAIGAVAVGGANPLGYFKDPAKTAMRFRSIDGSRFFLSGEHATVALDGTIERSDFGATLIVVDGRPVSAPPIEGVLRKHASVADCVVVGVPDPRSGERVIALIQVVESHYLDEPEMTAWCRSRLPEPETPSRFLFVPGPLPGGDRVSARRLAIEALARESH
jgi:3-oxocholest-4-en-26-oate---CoA ligase